MKVKIYHWYNALLSALLTVLGFGSCTETGPDEYGTLAAEYGTPYVDYIVRGSVTDEQGQPIGGMKAVVKEFYREHPDYTYGIDSTRTDADGKFKIQTRSHVYLNLELILEDTDGPENGGEFQSDTLLFEDMEKTLIEKGQHWSNGTYELKANVKLKKKP